MPVTFTFDIDVDSVADANDRTRILACFHRLGWEHIGGSAWRYPKLGPQPVHEDWFNHVVPALMYFRSLVEHANLRVTRFTIDAHSETGFREPNLGTPIDHAQNIQMLPLQVAAYDAVLSENVLRDFIQASANQL